MFYIRKVIHVDRILNKCPKCGSKLQFSNLMQFTRDYTIKRNGRLSAKSTRSDDCPMDASFVACTSCDFVTNCDGEYKDYERRIQVYSQDGVMNPARILKCMPPDTTYKEFMQMSITMLKMCDQIYMLKGWEKSCGANQEYGYALACDMIIESEV